MNKKYLQSLIFTLCPLLALSQNAFSPVTTPPNPPEGYKLVWTEEFDIDGKPDSSSWSYEEGFTRNEELQWYQPQNANVKEGLLVIEGKREQIKNDEYNADSRDWKKNREFAEYTSSSIHTSGKKTFKHGIVEVRARIDTARGVWPAIWTLGVSRGWPANGEIDIMEYYHIDGEPHILANAAWAHKSKRAAWDSVEIPFTAFLKKNPDWVEKFHVWKMDWTKDYIRLYLDDELLNEIDLDKVSNPDGFDPFQQPHYLLLNLAIGSNGGDPSGTKFPKKYEVDYVRVYQKKH